MLLKICLAIHLFGLSMMQIFLWQKWMVNNLLIKSDRMAYVLCVEGSVKLTTDSVYEVISNATMDVK